MYTLLTLVCIFPYSTHTEEVRLCRARWAGHYHAYTISIRTLDHYITIHVHAGSWYCFLHAIDVKREKFANQETKCEPKRSHPPLLPKSGENGHALGR